MVARWFESIGSSSSKPRAMIFVMTRTYETIIEVDADDLETAEKQLAEIDIYAVELEQCCVVDETITHE
jgi:hypothetical protein